ncbi:MAG: response regulator transcription factor [Deltaproteobacteria bacterium]|nr:response regulator transcription factor [Deltaproteobacteria bacterium]
MAKPQILIIDDDRALVDVLSMALGDAGYAVRTAHDGAKGWDAFRDEVPDLVILDLLMPGLDGLEVCRRIRVDHATPIVMLTSRGEEMDKVLGLEQGADDYVTKPFSTRELLARIKAALRREAMHAEGNSDDDRLRRGPLTIDRRRREVSLADTAITFTATEFDLLWTLVQAPGNVLSRRDLVDAVYGEDIVVADRTVDTFIKRLRQKLRSVDSSYAPIETVRAVGYRFREGST